MKLPIINDTHFGVRGDSEVFLENQLKFYDDVLFPYIEENNIKYLIHAGDVFDKRKNINTKTWEIVKARIFDRLKAMGVRVHCIVGNHDCYYKDTNKTNTPRALIAGEYDNWKIFDMDAKTLDYGNFKIALVPWICKENEARIMKHLETTDAKYVIGHFEIKGFDVNAGMPALHGMDRAVFKRFDMVLSGHYHTKSNQGNIHYLGAQSEFTWIDCNDPKAFHVLDTTTGELEAIYNKNIVFTRLVVDFEAKEKTKVPLDLAGKYVKLIVRGKADKAALEKYVTAIQIQGPADFKVDENEHAYTVDDGVDFESEDTLSLMYNYMDTLEIDADIPAIKAHLTELYTESLELE